MIPSKTPTRRRGAVGEDGGHSQGPEYRFYCLSAKDKNPEVGKGRSYVLSVVNARRARRMVPYPSVISIQLFYFQHTVPGTVLIGNPHQVEGNEYRLAEKKVIQNVAKTQTQQSEQHALQGVQINVPPITFPELGTVSKEVTERQKNAIDKVLEPQNSAAQNILDSNTFQKMTDSVLNSDLAPNEKVALCKQLVEMKDESDQKHADMINENIRVRTEAAERIRTSQGPTWDQIGNALLLAGKIGVKAFQFWVSMKGFMR